MFWAIVILVLVAPDLRSFNYFTKTAVDAGVCLINYYQNVNIYASDYSVRAVAAEAFGSACYADEACREYACAKLRELFDTVLDLRLQVMASLREIGSHGDIEYMAQALAIECGAK